MPNASNCEFFTYYNMFVESSDLGLASLILGSGGADAIRVALPGDGKVKLGSLVMASKEVGLFGSAGRFTNCSCSLATLSLVSLTTCYYGYY